MRYATVSRAGRLVAYVHMEPGGTVRVLPAPEREVVYAIDYSSEDRPRRRNISPEVSLPSGPGPEGSYHA